MKSRSLLLTCCALLVVACDDGAAPGEADPDLGRTRDVGILLPTADMASALVDADPMADAAPPVLDAEMSGDGGVEPDAMMPADRGVGPGDPCTPGEVRPCTGQCGLATCVDGAFGACAPGAERCNGHDDDCDDRIDNGYAGLGIGCVVDENGCVAQGTRVCSADGASVICDAPPAEPAPEVCDGDDDDCDGSVDEDFPGQVCCSDDLQCGPGEQCVGGLCEGGLAQGCASDFDCPLFQSCIQGQCVATCFSDFDCPLGEECNDFGVCGPPEPECVVDGDCFPTEECQAGACVPRPPPPCMDDAECPGLRVCQAGACVRPAGVTSCDEAVAMEGFGQYQGDNSVAFDDFGATCGAADNGPEQFFLFTVEVPTRVTLDSTGSSFDTVIEVLDGCAAGARVMACNDDIGGGNTDSRVTFDAMPGVQYAAGVHGYDDNETGPIALAYSGIEICLADADCGEGEQCRDGTCRATPCLGAIEMPMFGAYAGSNVGALDESDATCGSANESGEQVFTFQFDEPARISLDTVGTAFDAVMSVRTDCGDVATQVACDDDSAGAQQSAVDFQAAAGVRYYVLVEGYGANAAGNISLNFDGRVFEPPAPCDDACEGICVNGMCAPPIPALCDGTTTIGEVPNGYTGNTATDGVHRLSPPCGVAGNAPELVLVVMFPVDEVVYASTFGSAFDTVLYVLEGCDPDAVVACNDDMGAFNTDSEVSFVAEAGVPYYIVVDGYNAASGAFDLVVELE